jgi:hypothetical protein
MNNSDKSKEELDVPDFIKNSLLFSLKLEAANKNELSSSNCSKENLLIKQQLQQQQIEYLQKQIDKFVLDESPIDSGDDEYKTVLKFKLLDDDDDDDDDEDGDSTTKKTITTQNDNSTHNDNSIVDSSNSKVATKKTNKIQTQTDTEFNKSKAEFENDLQKSKSN